MKIRPEKNIQACTGFEPVTSAIPVQRLPTDLTSWLVQSQTLSLLARFLFVNPEKKKKKKIRVVNHAYGPFVLECIPIVAQRKKSVPKKLKPIYHRLDSLTELIVGKMRMAKLNHHNQNIPDSVTHPRSLITYCFKFFHQVSLVRFSSIS